MPDPIKGNPNPAPGTPAENPNPNPPAPAKGDPTPPASGKPGEPNPTVPLSALHESREQTRTIKEEVDKLKSVLANVHQQYGITPANPNPATPVYGPSPTMQNNARALEDMWDENPRDAMRTELSMALSYYDETQSILDAQEFEAAKKYPDFETYRSQIKRYVRMVKPDQRRNPGTVDTAYFLAKGQNTDGIKQAAIDDIIRKIKAGEVVQGIEGASASPQAPPAVLKPTADQINAAAVMGMPIEDYLKNVKK